jgi:polyhydroxybutyrate depolymerase
VKKKSPEQATLQSAPLQQSLSRRRLLQLGLSAAAAVGLAGSGLPQRAQAGWGDGGLKKQRIGEREYLLQLPSKRSRPAGKMPVLMLFHGGGGKAKGFAEYSGFMALCDQLGFIGVYPQGVDKHWYDARYRTVHPAPAGVDDVVFVSAILDRLEAVSQADMQRVYAMGMSNGGIFCQQLAMALSGRLAAVASVCGQLPQPLAAGFNPDSPLSVLLMNGTEDPIVPYHGGEVGMRRRWGPKKGSKNASGRVIATDRNLHLWVKHNHLPARPITSELPDTAPGDGCRVQHLRWVRGNADVSVELYRIQGGGHAIPGRPQYLPKKVIGRVCRDIDGAQVIWDFFMRHQLNA